MNKNIKIKLYSIQQSIMNIEELIIKNKLLEDENKKFDRLVELNVQEQVLHLAKTSIIQRAWQNEQRPQIHGWVYSLKDGIINPVCELNPDADIEALYKYDDI